VTCQYCKDDGVDASSDNGDTLTHCPRCGSFMVWTEHGVILFLTEEAKNNRDKNNPYRRKLLNL